MNLEELKRQIEAKKLEVRGFISAKDSENAKKANEELRQLKETLKIAEELEEEERRSLERQRDLSKRVPTGEVNEMRAIVKSVMGEELTPEERTNIKTTDNAEEVEGVTDYSDIQMVIDKSVPAVKNGLVTFTNTDGYAYLKNLRDTQNRPLNLVTEVNGKYYFNGKELVVVDDTLLTATPSKKIFIVANPKEAVKFIERKGVTIARSTEAGFRDDTVKLRILERLDVIKGATRSIKKIEFTVTP